MSNKKIDITSMYNIHASDDSWCDDVPAAKSWNDLIEKLKTPKCVPVNVISQKIFDDFVQKIEASSSRAIVKSAIDSIGEDVGIDATEIRFNSRIVDEQGKHYQLALSVYGTESTDTCSEEERDHAPYNVLEVSFPPVSYRIQF